MAYNNRYTALEKEITNLTSKVKELTGQLRDSEDKIAESELLLQELREKNQKLTEENEKMTTNLRKLKIENSRLNSLANNIKTTIDASSSQIICEPEPAKEKLSVQKNEKITGFATMDNQEYF